jgi:LmbE family N-acetylglucosaminyl deacetylase
MYINNFRQGGTIEVMEQPVFSELTPKVVLGIAAHPDDLDFSSSGTLAKFAAQGAAVHYLILTDGSSGSEDRTISPDELSKTREAEQHAAVAAIGGASAQFLGHPDGHLVVSIALKKEIVKVIRTLKPEVVITMDPSVLYSAERGFINHPDHRAAGQAALDAVFPLARDHMSFPELLAEGFEPFKVKTVLLTNFQKQNFVVDITDTFDKKLAALQAHASQVPDINEVAPWLREVDAMIGKPHGYALGEGFIRIDVRQ